jgi:hypothetical protein
MRELAYISTRLWTKSGDYPAVLIFLIMANQRAVSVSTDDGLAKRQVKEFNSI